MFTDTLVIGGGPAGAATALALASRGSRVMLLERQPVPIWKIGETLSPHAWSALQMLGIERKFAEEGHLRSYGICSAWGTHELATQDFICHPYGCGWQLDRARFEQFLLNMAAGAGAKILCGVSAQSVARLREGWEIGSSRGAITCRWLVDATGRQSFLARHLANDCQRWDKSVSIYAVARAEGGRDQDARTWIESVPDGWWYTAMVPGGRRTIAWQTDALLLPNHAGRSRSWFQEKLRATVHLERLLARYDYQFAGRPLAAAAQSFRLQNFCGENWIAVGDAAMSFDPLSGRGLCKALETGQLAARTITGDGVMGLAAYARWSEELWVSFVKQRREYYSLERRWDNEPFWNKMVAPKINEFGIAF